MQWGQSETTFNKEGYQFHQNSRAHFFTPPSLSTPASKRVRHILILQPCYERLYESFSKLHLRWFRSWRNILLYIYDVQIPTHLARVFFLCILISRCLRCLIYKDSSFKIRALCADCLGTYLKIVLAVNLGIGWPSGSAPKANISALVLTQNSLVHLNEQKVILPSRPGDNFCPLMRLIPLCWSMLIS